MSNGTLKTALALWIASLLPGVLVIGTRAANRKGRYPECLVTMVSCDSPQFVGLPLGTASRRDEHGVVMAEVKTYTETSHYRLTFRAIDTQTETGQKKVELLRETVKAAVMALSETDSDVAITLRDSECTPAEDFEIDSIDKETEQDLPPEVEQEPFIYQCTLTLRLERTCETERRVVHTFQETQATLDDETEQPD